MKAKKILSLLLSLLMLVSLVPGMALAAEEAPAEEAAEAAPAEETVIEESVPAEEEPAAEPEAPAEEAEEEVPVEEAPAEEVPAEEPAELPAEEPQTDGSAEPEETAEDHLSGSGYVLMNIPYDEFYAAEGDDSVDAVTSATKSKPRVSGLAGGSYHVNADGTDITGITYPVYVEDLSVLADCTEVTDETSVDITVTNRGNTSTTTYTGSDALFESPSYSFYLLDSTPAAYKTLQVTDGAFSFGEVIARKTSVCTGVTGSVTFGGRHTDVEIKLSGTGYDGVCVSAVVLTLDDGTEYGLRHVYNIWRGSEIGFNLDESDYGEIAGRTITNIRYYTTDEIVDCPVSIAVISQNSAYVLMNIPYDEFYAAEGDDNVDAVTSATKSKPLSGGLAGGSYHVNADGTDITGVIYPVYVEDLSVLADYPEITDASTVDITTTNRGSTSTTTYTGSDALFQSASYSYYVLTDVPATYKTLTAAEDGSFSFSAASADVSVEDGVTGSVTVGGRHTDVEIKLSGMTDIDSSTKVSGVVLTLDDGTQYGLRHVYNIWRGTELGFDTDGDYAQISGHTITNIRYYTIDGTFDYPVDIAVLPAAAVQNGWQADGDEWYYAKNGTLLKDSWVWYSGSWYYLGRDGHMLADTFLEVDGTTYYYFDASGVMQTGWQYIDSTWYYFYSNGMMAADTMLTWGSAVYYLDEDGEMAADATVEYRGGTYYAGKDGVLVSSCWQQIDDVWYFFDENGMMLESEWLYWGCWYYLTADGSMAADETVTVDDSVYCFAASGAMYENSWQYLENARLGDGWHYFDASGAQVTGSWIWWYGSWYCVDENGIMYADTVTPDGCTVDATGAWVE